MRHRFVLVLASGLCACAPQVPRSAPMAPQALSVRVTPNPLLLTVGSTDTLTAIIVGAGGVVITGRPIIWSSDDTLVVRVSTNGQLAGLRAGSAEIRATSDGVSGTALVAVSAAPASALVRDTVPALAPRSSLPPTVRPAPDAEGVSPRTSPLTGECARPRPEWLWCDDFEIDRLGAYFEYDSAGGSFLRSEVAGAEGSHGMRARWAPRQVGAGALHLAVGRTPQRYMRSPDGSDAVHRELYWRFYVRNQPGWTGGGGDKLTRAFVFASPTSWAQAAILHVWSGGDGTPTEEMLVLDPARGTDEAGTLRTTTYNDFRALTWLGVGAGAQRIFSAEQVGHWQCIEVHARLNDADRSNGMVELWVNGRLDAERRGLNLLGAFGPYGLNAVYLENYWNAGSPVAQERSLDNFVVSTTRIGC